MTIVFKKEWKSRYYKYAFNVASSFAITRYEKSDIQYSYARLIATIILSFKDAYFILKNKPSMMGGELREVV